MQLLTLAGVATKMEKLQRFMDVCKRSTTSQIWSSSGPRVWIFTCVAAKQPSVGPGVGRFGGVCGLLIKATCFRPQNPGIDVNGVGSNPQTRLLSLLDGRRKELLS